MNLSRITVLVQGVDGGIASLVVGLLQFADLEKVQFQVIFLGSRGSGETAARLRGFRNCVTKSYISSLDGPVSRSVYFLAASKRIDGAIAAFDPDLVVCAGLVPALLCGLLLRGCRRRRCLFWEHGPQYSFSNLKRLLLGMCHGAFEGVVSPSESSSRVFSGQFPFFDAEKISVVSNGVDISRIREIDRQMSFNRELRVIMPARFDTAQKNQEVLVLGVRKLVQARIPVSVTLAGDGPSRARVERLIANLGLSAVIRTPGHINDLPGELIRHNIVLLSTRWEGFPLCLLEGMIAGLLCMGSNVCGVSDAIRHGETGILFAPDSPTALADAPQAVFERPAEHACIADQGQRFAREHFTLCAMKKRIEEYYRTHLLSVAA